MVDAHEALLDDAQRLVAGQRVLQAVAQEHHQRQALAQAVRARARPRRVHAAQLVQHPCAGRVQPLQVLLGTASLPGNKHHGLTAADLRSGRPRPAVASRGLVAVVAPRSLSIVHICIMFRPIDRSATHGLRSIVPGYPVGPIEISLSERSEDMGLRLRMDSDTVFIVLHHDFNGFSE